MKDSYDWTSNFYHGFLLDSTSFLLNDRRVLSLREIR